MRSWLSAVVVLAVAGTRLPAGWLWGLNHGSWLPWQLTLPLGAVVLAVVWTPLGGVLGRLWCRAVASQVLDRPAVAYGVVPALGATLGWLARDRAHLLGDGAMFGELVARGRIFHGFDAMGYHLPARLHGALGLDGEAAALQVFAAVSIVAGAAHLAAAAWAARAVGRDAGERALLYALLVVTPGWFLFCGYVEAYPMLAVFLLLYAARLVLFAEGRASYRSVVLAWSAAFFWHLNALFLWPLLPLAAWLAREDAQGPPWRRWAGALAAPLATAAVIAAVYAMAGDGSGLAADALPTIDHEHGALVDLTGREGLLSLLHLKDAANLLLLLAAVPLALLAGRRLPVSSLRQPGLVLTLAGAALCAALAVGIHFKLGLARDWDLLAPHAVVVALAAFLVLRARGDDPVAVAGPALAVALLLTGTWVAVNADADLPATRIEQVTVDLDSHARGLVLENLARRRRLAGDEAGALRLYGLAADACPGNPRFPALHAASLLNRGDTAGARAAFARSLAADSTYAYALLHAAQLDLMAGRYDDARRLAGRMAGRPDESADAALIHATAAEATGRWNEAAAAYRRALALAPERPEIGERLAGTLLMAGDTAGAAAAFRAILERRPDHLHAKLGLADAVWQGGARDPRSLAEVARLLDELGAAIGADPGAAGELGVTDGDLRRWRQEVEAARAGATAEPTTEGVRR